MCLLLSDDVKLEFDQDGYCTVYKVLIHQDGEYYTLYKHMEFKPGVNKAAGAVDIENGRLFGGAIHVFLYKDDALDHKEYAQNSALMEYKSCKIDVVALRCHKDDLVAVGYGNNNAENAAFTKVYWDGPFYLRKIRVCVFSLMMKLKLSLMKTVTVPHTKC